MHATRSKHRNLKLNPNRRSDPWFGPHGRHEVNFCVNVALSLTRETLDAPDNGLLFRFIFGSAKESLDFGLRSILRNRNLDDNVSSKQLIREIGDDLEINGNSVRGQDENL